MEACIGGEEESDPLVLEEEFGSCPFSFSTASTSPKSLGDLAAGCSLEAKDSHLELLPRAERPPLTTRSRPRAIVDDFQEGPSFSLTLTERLQRLMRFFLHPAALSPLAFHRNTQSDVTASEEGGDFVSSVEPHAAISEDSTALLLRRCCSLQPPPAETHRKLRSRWRLFAGLSLRGCLAEAAGTFAVSLAVHAAASASTVGSPTAGRRALTLRLPLLAYAVVAALGCFCNPAFLYAGYMALSAWPWPATFRGCDAVRMSCASVNLLVALQYAAAGCAALLAFAVLPFDAAAVDAPESALLAPRLLWTALGETCGAFLVAVAVLQLISLSSFFYSSREGSAEKRRAELRPPLEEALPGGLTVASASAPRGVAYFSAKSALYVQGPPPEASSCGKGPDTRSGVKLRAAAVALPLLLLVLAFHLPPSPSSLNPAIAYTARYTRHHRAPAPQGARGAGPGTSIAAATTVGSGGEPPGPPLKEAQLRAAAGRGGGPSAELSPSVLETGLGEETREVEGVRLLGREEGDGETLFEFDEACEGAAHYFAFFLLSSFAPYAGAQLAALLWRRCGERLLLLRGGAAACGPCSS